MGIIQNPNIAIKTIGEGAGEITITINILIVQAKGEGVIITLDPCQIKGAKGEGVVMVPGEGEDKHQLHQESPKGGTGSAIGAEIL